MDKKILNALNDITIGLEELANALKSKKTASSNTAQVLQSGNFGKQIESIKVGLSAIKKDTEKILKNQETLLNISREKKSQSPFFQNIGEKKEKVKEGVSTVLLIAAGVLAIGLAFKLIGTVDFLSVIALSVALPLVAMAFVKISEMKGLKPAEMKNLFFVVVTMAASIAAASWILSLVHPISIKQGITSILIAATFAAISFNIEKMASGFEKIKPEAIKKMPFVLVSVAVAITASSWIMGLILPISIWQGLTAILIAATFTVMAYGIEKIANGIKNIEPKDMTKMPLVLVAFALAITASSWIMALIVPISFNQGLTAIIIAATLAVMSLALPSLALAVKTTSIKDALLMTAILPLLALAIAVSSWALQMVVPVDAGILGNMVIMSLALGISSVIMGGAAWVLAKIGLEAIAEGSIAIVILAGVLALSSQLIALGKYDNYPTLEWAAGVGLSLVAFGLSAVVLGIIAMSGIGAVALLAGGAAVLILSGVIVAASYILGAGSYGNYPTLAWSTGVSLSLAAFGVGTMMLGAFIVGSFGLGLAVLAAGALGVLVIAQSIVDASAILGKGTYSGGPTKEWAEGISLALGAFAPVFKTLFDRGIIGLFSKGPSAQDFADAITTVSSGIVTAGKFFMSVPNIWTGGPTAEWAAGVGGAIGAFAPVFDALAKSSGLFGSGPAPEDMIKAMLNISSAIVQVGKFFMSVPNIWTGGPTADWSAGISGALSAFAPVFDYLDKNSHWYGNDDFSAINNAIVSIAGAMVDSANVLNKGSFGNSIPEGYMKSMSDNIKVYVDLVEYLQAKDIGPLSFLNVIGITYGLSKIANGYDALSKSVKSLSTSINSLDLQKLDSLKTLSGSVVLLSLMDKDQFTKMMDELEAKTGIFVNIMDQLGGAGAANNKSFGSINSVKNGSATTGGATIDDLVAEQRQTNIYLGSMVKSCNTFVTFIDELRGSNNSIKNKKHMQ